jgi:hypothetical protein
LSVDAGVCGEPTSQCAREASGYIAVERVAILGTLIARGTDFRGLSAEMLRVGTWAVAVQMGAPPLYPARIAGSHFGPPWGSWWLGVGRWWYIGRRRLLSDSKLPHPDPDGNCRNSANRMLATT